MNIEAKLGGVNDTEVEDGKDPKGVVLFRGPPVGKMVSPESEVGSDSEYVDVGTSESKTQADDDGWIAAEVEAKVMSNGAFVVLGK